MPILGRNGLNSWEKQRKTADKLGRDRCGAFLLPRLQEGLAALASCTGRGLHTMVCVVKDKELLEGTPRVPWMQNPSPLPGAAANAH